MRSAVGPVDRLVDARLPYRASVARFPTPGDPAGTARAMCGGKHAVRFGVEAYTILNVGFSSRATCIPEVGFAILTSKSYGDVVGRYPGNQAVTITVDNEQPRVLSTKATKYSNGFENMFLADSALLSVLSVSQGVRVKLIDGAPTFAMETSGAGTAIAKAKAACLARR